MSGNIRKALWREVEIMAPKERKEVYGPLIELAKSKDEETRLKASKELHSLFSSFLCSKEWRRDFRGKFLKANPVCVGYKRFKFCKKKADRVHHEPSMRETFIDKGFLEPLKDWNNFKPSCHDCHSWLESEYELKLKQK